MPCYNGENVGKVVDHMVWLAVILFAFVGGILQTVTGFGAGVVMIMAFSRLFDITVAASLNTAICAVLSLSLAWQFRKEIQWKLIAVPEIPYILTSVLVIRTISSMDMSVLAVIFGIFLISLSVFFFFFEKRVHLQGTPPTALTCGAISGVFSGLFGVGGPLMALYFVTIMPGRVAYVASMQCFFLISNVISLITRFSEGLYTVSLFPITAAGIAAIMAGKWVGLRIADRLDGEKLKRIVYIFVGVSGAVTLLQQIL